LTTEDHENNNYKLENAEADNNNTNGQPVDISSQKTGKEYRQIDKNELTFPDLRGMKNANVVRDYTNSNSNERTDPSNPNNLHFKNDKVAKIKIAPQVKDEPYPIEQLEFLHLPKDPVYLPIPLELVKANEFKEDEITYSTRIIMNLAISDYAVFRKIDFDTGDTTEAIKLPFKRVPMVILQNYIDRQGYIDNIVRTINMIGMLKDPTREDIQRLNELQVEMNETIRDRVKYGFRAFFKVPQEILEIYDELDYNDILFNVDAGFFRLTKSPFLRRLL